jgi:hypothetical protein
VVQGCTVHGAKDANPGLVPRKEFETMTIITNEIKEEI